MSCHKFPDWPIFAKIPSDLSKRATAFHVFGSNGGELIVCTTGNSVYRSQLDGSSSNEPFQELLSLRGKQIQQIITSERSTVLILTNDGELFAFGNNQYGQVGNSESGGAVREPYLVSGAAPISNDRVVQIATGCYHCACVTESGDLFTWGAWRAGDQLRKLGHNDNSLTPCRVDAINQHSDQGLKRPKFVKVACTSETTFAIDDLGGVYSCGENKFLNFNNERIVQLSCASGHSLALSSYGSVFAWGKNYRKQLGLQLDEDPIKEPKRIATFDNPYMRIVSVLAFNTTSLALSHNGIPYVWGETRLSGKVQFYYAQAERELDEKNKNSNNYYYWMLPRTCISSIPTPASAAAKGSLFAVLQEEMTGPLVTPHLIKLVDDFNEVERGLNEIFDDAETSDFKILVEGHVIHAHRSILLNRSGHFRTMLSSTPSFWREGNENVLEVKDATYPVYRAFIFYLYKGYLPDALTMEETFALVDIADLYFHDDLHPKVYDFALAKWLTKEDAFELCGVALRKKADMVVSRCTSFILNNLSAVTRLASFDKLLEFIDAKDILAIYQKANQAQLFKT